MNQINTPTASAEDAFLADVAANKPREQTIFDSVDELVDHLNTVAAVLLKGNDVRIVMWNRDGQPILLKESQAKTWLAKYRLDVSDEKKTKLIPGYDAWIGSERRKEFKRMTFNPNPDTRQEGDLELFQGFAVEAAEGDWTLLRTHIFENVCRKNQETYDFLIRWMAHLVQFPWKKNGVAIVLRGEMGTGKTKLSDWLGNIIGHHYCPVVDSPEHLTGRFNGHLETALLVRVEEGFYPGAPAEKSRLKHLITSHKITIERKNLDAYLADNYARVLITSNSDWVVAAARGERRYLFLDVGDAQAKNGPYFAAIDKQMENGGAQAMMHDLMTMDLAGVDFSKPPMTDGLVSQMRQGFSNEEKWLESILIEGRIPFRSTAPAEDFVSELAWNDDDPEAYLEITKDTLLASYRDFVPGFRAPPTSQVLGAMLAKYVPGLKQGKRTYSSGRIPIYILPPLDKMRAHFLATNAGYIFPVEIACEPSPQPGVTDAAVLSFSAAKGAKKGVKAA